MPKENWKIEIAPDLEFAKLTVERFETGHRKLKINEKRILHTLSSHSHFLARAALRDPEVVSFPLTNKIKTRAATEKQLISLGHRVKNTDKFFKELRLFKYRRLAQIIYEDINGGSFIKTMAALSDLAGAVVEASLVKLSNDMGINDAGRFCVLAMGKLSGMQLNLSSDIDLIYIYEDKGDARPFVDLAQRLTTEIGANTENGFLYRVDLGLRPAGMKGPIAIHIEGALEHYFRMGETWEKIALMKASPVAGDKKLGNELLTKLDPFIYGANMDYGLIEDMGEMKRRLARIRKQLDLKLGAGGIREIEFFTQTLQILNGANAKLRDANTLSALKKLLQRKTISRETENILANNYIFLRKVEHNVQLDEETQTHSIPNSPAKITKLAKMTGFSDAGEFEKTLRETMEETSNICGELFKDESDRDSKEKTSLEEWEKEEAIITEFFTTGDASREEALQSLVSLGFRFPEDSLEILSDLERPTLAEEAESDSRSRGLVKKLLRVLFEQVHAGVCSDLTLINLKHLMTYQEWRMSTYPLISAAPEMLKIFLKIISSNSSVSSCLVRYPYYISSVALKTRGWLREKKEIVQSLEEIMRQQGSYEESLETMCHFKYTEMLKLCVAQFENQTDFIHTGKYLSLLAATVLEVALSLSKKLAGKHSTGATVTKSCVLGMGKLGGCELSYSSDLDIIFLHDGDKTEQYTHLAQRLLGLLSFSDSCGRLYETDTDLRPSGKSGTLVTSLDAFKKYHEARGGARLWERQALIKATPCAGGNNFGKKVMETVEKYAYTMPLEPGFHREIAHLRQRMEKELAREDDKVFNFKTGKGGMVDVEFLVQALQLKHGAKHTGVRKPNTIEALDSLTALKILGKRESKTLRDGYIFLGTLSNLQGIFKNRHGNSLRLYDFERLSHEFEAFSTAKKLRAEYISTTQAIRKIYKGFFN